MDSMNSEYKHLVENGAPICPFCGADGVEEVEVVDDNVFALGLGGDDAGWYETRCVCPTCEKEFAVMALLTARERKVFTWAS